MHLFWLPFGLLFVFLLFWPLGFARCGWRHAAYTQPVQTPPGEDPIGILRKRLAGGDITQEEYDRILPLLK